MSTLDFAEARTALFLAGRSWSPWSMEKMMTQKGCKDLGMGQNPGT